MSNANLLPPPQSTSGGTTRRHPFEIANTTPIYGSFLEFRRKQQQHT